MNNTLSLPREWLHILNEEHPPLSMEFLMKEATVNDVYDALEFLEVKKFLRAEAEKQEKANGNKD